MSFTEQIDDVVIYEKRKYVVCAYFNRVLEVQRLFKEEELSDYIKIRQALKNVVAK